MQKLSGWHPGGAEPDTQNTEQMFGDKNIKSPWDSHK